MDILYQDPSLKNKERIFEDRFDAGDRLVEALGQIYANLSEGIVLAIPSGGVPIGIRVARSLGLPLDLIMVRKLQIPGNTEAGFGAMSQDGEVFLNQELVEHLRLSQEQIQRQKQKVKQELAARNREFRANRPFPDLKGKTVIIVDDGLASGFTMLASINLVKQKGAARITVAVPTAPFRSIENIAPYANEIYSLHVQELGGAFAVANAYQNWHDLSREEVKELLGQSEVTKVWNKT